MKIGDLVKIKKEGVDKEPGHGMVIGFKFRSEPEWDDAVVYWAGFGISYHMKALLEVI